MPPVAVLVYGKPIQALLNVLLTLCLWMPGAIHAVLVVHSYEARKNTDRVVRAVERQDRLAREAEERLAREAGATRGR